MIKGYLPTVGIKFLKIAILCQPDLHKYHPIMNTESFDNLYIKITFDL